jgi:chromosome segregation ATPase
VIWDPWEVTIVPFPFDDQAGSKRHQKRRRRDAYSVLAVCYTRTTMAFNVTDLGELLALLRQHPEWREAVRREVLTEELLALPTIVGRLAETQEQLASQVRQQASQMEQLTIRMDQLTTRMDQLTARMDQLATRMDQLTARMDQLATRMDQLTARMEQLAARMEQLAAEVRLLTADVRQLGSIVERLDGRVGNLEEWRYERRFNARARLTEIVREPVEVNLADLEAVLDARDQDRVTDKEWKQLLALDILFKGRLGPGRDAPEHLVALEVSRAVDSRDVQRAYDRAAILARIGLAAIPVVGGRRLTDEAAALAERLAVRRLIDWSDEG